MSISKRIESIDILRGIIMIIMCLDHTRDYFQDLNAAGWPMDLATTTPALFFTRYITHFCAPLFVLLSGISIYLQSQRKSKNELSIFLLTRGMWLILLEIVLNNFIWFFDIKYTILHFQVIWAIGASMVVMALIIRLNKYVILLIGILIVFGHNLLDGITTESTGFKGIVWRLIHQSGGFGDPEHRWFSISYPMLPWLGIMVIGFVIGSLYNSNISSKSRQNWLSIIGFSSLALFFLLRTFNIYGDPNWHFEWQESTFENIVSFIRITKYPPSLQYSLVTVGIGLIVLGRLENIKSKVSDFFLTFGKVALFFYFLHMIVIHLSSMLLKPLFGDVMYSSVNNYENYLNEKHVYLGVNLIWVYIIWVIIILLLYLPCKKYMKYKMNNKDKKWLSYL